jgi:predicted MFS family arabinose efflux permease
VGAGMFGIFLFLTYYLQDTLGYSPVITGVAFLPMIAGVATSSNVSNIVLMPRIGPKPIVTAGLLFAAAGMVWLTRITPHSGYAANILGPLIVTGLGMGLMFSTAFNTGTYGVAPQDTGVASASVNTGQQLGGAIGTALLNTIAASATAAYLTSHLHGRPTPALTQLALVHGYTTAFWWCAGIFLGGAVLCGSLMRSGPLQGRTPQPAATPGGAGAEAEASAPV